MIKNVKGIIAYAGIAACMLCFNTISQAQVDTATLSQKLERAKDKIGKDAVFLLYKDGKTVYKKELGKFNIKTEQPVFASSEWLTAALVLIMVQEGKLSLNNKVSDYIPLYAKHGKGYITIAHCITHNTGIQADQGISKFFKKSNYKTLEEEVNDYAAKKEIETNPGTQFKYSNMGFDIAGRILEIISKRPFDRLMQEKLLRPLAMRNTTFTNENYNDALSPATGAKTTPADYINFLGMLVNKGRFNNKQIMNEVTVNTLLSLQYPADKINNEPKNVNGLDYAYGNWILDKNSAGKTTMASSPSMFGTWPVINLCRGYACLLFTKELSNDLSNELVNDLMATIDEKVPAKCDQ